MKKAIAPIALIALVFVGGVAAYIATNPGGASGEAGAKSGTADAKPAAEGSFDRRAASAAAPPAAKSTAEATRPPSRAQAEAASAEEERMRPSRRGRFIGEMRIPVDSPPPLAELYPFQVVRRSFPDSNTMTVEFAVRNSSGSQWRSAYVVIRSAQHPVNYQFEINDWQIDEVVGLEYTFPNSERERRLDKLRIVAVLGDKRESALADMLAQTRRKLVETAVAADPAPRRARAGDSLQAPGLLSVLGGVQSGLTGIAVRTSMTVNAADMILQVNAPNESLVDRDLGLELRETSEERLAAAELAREFHAATIRTQDALAGFCRAVSSGPFGPAMEGPAGEQLQSAREGLTTLNELGVRLAITAQRSRDNEVRRLAELVPQHSNKILSQISSIETQVRRLDPHFRIQEVQ